LKHLNYTYQDGEGGIAEALGLAEYFAGDEQVCVVLGDNIIENNICRAVEMFKKQKEGAKVLLKEVADADRFGVAEIRGNRVVGIEEKPKAPKSKYAVIGVYLYDSTVFQKIRRLKPSGRGELEITDVNNFYIEENSLTYEFLDGWWTDAGTFDSLLRASGLVAKTGANKMGGGNSAGDADRQDVKR
jgi:glucose-1-phosphate thymidylyltransferase